MREPTPHGAGPQPGEGPLPAEEAGPGQTSGRQQAAWRELVRFLPDVARLLWHLARDPRVPWHAKVVAGGAVAYVVSPVDLIPDFLPMGRLDDLYLVGRALRYLFNAAGYDLVREQWGGTDDGFALLLVVAGIRD